METQANHSSDKDNQAEGSFEEQLAKLKETLAICEKEANDFKE